jgi:hypothetical protein
MGIYGKLTAQSEEHLAAEIAEEKRTTNGVYGPLVIDNAQPGVADAAPLEETPIGSDYTINELMAAIEGDPALAKELVLTELKRPQGARKGALRYFAELETLDDDTQKLVNDALGIFAAPTE